MLTGRVEGRFLQLAVQLAVTSHRRNRRLYRLLGPCNGRGSAHDGEILTLEHNPHWAKIAQDFFDRSSSGFKITLRMGEALEILKTLPDAKTDLVFIDADKQNYSAISRRIDEDFA